MDTTFLPGTNCKKGDLVVGPIRRLYFILGFCGENFQRKSTWMTTLSGSSWTHSLVPSWTLLLGLSLHVCAAESCGVFSCSSSKQSCTVPSYVSRLCFPSVNHCCHDIGLFSNVRRVEVSYSCTGFRGRAITRLNAVSGGSATMLKNK